MKNIFTFKSILALCLALIFAGSISAQEFRYFLAQHEGNTTIIYNVELSGSDANLLPLTSVDYRAHISFKEGTEEIFIVNEVNADFQSYDIESGIMSPVFDIDAANGSYVAAAFNGSSIIIGNGSNGRLYSNPVDFLTNSLTPIASGPVSGGDIVYKGETVYLATRSSNRLMVLNGSSFDLVSNIPQRVTGMALAENGNLILSFFGSSVLKEYTTSGTFVTDYNLRTVTGAPYTGLNGDLASGSVVVACLPSAIVDYAQGAKWDGLTPVSAERSILSNALGMPEMSDATTPESEVNFFTLGFGGFVTYEFENGIANGPGADVRVYETTFGNSSTDNLPNSCARYKERIQGFASQDGCNYWYIGEGCQNTDFDLGYGGAPFTWAKYIKLVDVSDRADFNNGDDGYDVDGIVCLNGSSENTELEGEFGGATSAELVQGFQNGGGAVALSRSDKTKALGIPQGNDAQNSFVSLGFGGKITLKFDFVVFDQAGPDLQIVETSFGNPSCNSYPETVMIRGSLNGTDYFEISPDVCLDGEVDLAGYGPIQYLELTDRSAHSSFSGSADGYDLDGVVVLTNCNGDAIDQARIADNVTTPDEIGGLSAYPNPFSNVVTVEISTAENDTEALVEVNNYLGQRVSLERINVAPTSVVLYNVNARELDKGIYFITVTTNSLKETMKVVKH